MPYIWLENDELRAVRAVIDWRSRIGQPLDWAAYDRGMARLATGPTQHVPARGQPRGSGRAPEAATACVHGPLTDERSTCTSHVDANTDTTWTTERRQSANCERLPALRDFPCSEAAMPHSTVLKRMRAEYLEMPGLRLTLEQAQRLCGVERALCKMVLDALVADKFLCVKSDGAYARLTEGVISRPRPVKAALGVERRVATAS